MTAGDTRTAATEVIVVVLFAAASISHAVFRGALGPLSSSGSRWRSGFLVELLGTSTGFPFSLLLHRSTQPAGSGRAADHPARVDHDVVSGTAGRVDVSPAAEWLRILVGAFALASWDLFLDPRWSAGLLALGTARAGASGVPGIPIVNYLGWLLAAGVLMAALSVLPDVAAPEGVLATLFLWTWVGGIVANAVFLGRLGGPFGAASAWAAAVPYAVSFLYRAWRRGSRCRCPAARPAGSPLAVP